MTEIDIEKERRHRPVAPPPEAMRDMADQLRGLVDLHSAASVAVLEAAAMLEFSAKRASVGSAEPVAWVLGEELEKCETTCNAHLWFSDPLNACWTAIYTDPPSTDAKDEKILGLLKEVSATLKMWADVAPAFSLIKDIDAAIAAKEPK